MSILLAAVLVLDSSAGLVITAGECSGDVRVLEARALTGGAVSFSESDWAALPCDLRLVPEGERYHGYPWAGGAEQSGALVRTQRAELGVPAIVVTLERGFEHVHRRHALFIAGPKGAIRAWEDGDLTGPAYSTVVATNGALLYTYVFDYGGEDVPDSFRVERVTWKAKKAVAVPAPIWIAIGGTHADLASARLAEAKLEKECERDDLLVVESDGFPKLAPKKVVIGAFDSSEAGARAAADALRRCAKDAYVKRAR